MVRASIGILAAIMLVSPAAAGRRSPESAPYQFLGSGGHGRSLPGAARMPAWNDPRAVMPPPGWGRRPGGNRGMPLSLWNGLGPPAIILIP